MFLIIVVIIIGLSYSFAKSEVGIPSTEPTDPDAPSASVSKTFVYQGVLKENGIPVTGIRSMSFILAKSDYHGFGVDCLAHPDMLDAVNATAPVDVQVQNGLFSIAPTWGPYLSSDFHDQNVLYIMTYVSGNLVACEELFPVPYALNIVAGAGTNSDLPGDAVLFSMNTNTTEAYSNGLLGSSSAPTSAGVWGSTDHAQGYGVVGESENGIAVYAEGKFKSTKESVLVLSPHTMQMRYGTTGLAFEPRDNGAVTVTSTGGADGKYITLPVSTFGTLFGTPMYVKSLDVCYSVSNIIAVDILDTQVLKNNGSTGYSVMLTDSTVRDSYNHACYTVSTTTPVILDNSTWVQFHLTLPIGYQAHFYTAKLTLTEVTP